MRVARLVLATVAILPAVSARAELPAWLLEGERLTYTLTWLGFTGGTLVLEANQPAGEPTFRLTMRARSSSFVSKIIEVDDSFETRLDPARVTTTLSTKSTREGKHRLQERVEFDPVAGTARRWKNGTEREPLRTPAPVLDTLAAIYFIRTLPLAAGKKFQLTVQSGSKVYLMEVAVLEQIRASTALGRIDVLVVEPRFAEGGGLLGGKGKSTLWVTAESPHTLVRISSELPFGSLTARLDKVERPWQAVLESSRGQGGSGK